jgi:hypothetical protein
MHEEITLNYADLEALKRQSGPPSFTLIGISTKHVSVHFNKREIEFYLLN